MYVLNIVVEVFDVFLYSWFGKVWDMEEFVVRFFVYGVRWVVDFVLVVCWRWCVGVRVVIMYFYYF